MLNSCSVICLRSISSCFVPVLFRPVLSPSRFVPFFCPIWDWTAILLNLASFKTIRNDSAQFSSIQLNSAQFGSIQLNSTQLSLTQLSSIQLNLFLYNLASSQVTTVRSVMFKSMVHSCVWCRKTKEKEQEFTQKTDMRPKVVIIFLSQK